MKEWKTFYKYRSAAIWTTINAKLVLDSKVRNVTFWKCQMQLFSIVADAYQQKRYILFMIKELYRKVLVISYWICCFWLFLMGFSYLLCALVGSLLNNREFSIHLLFTCSLVHLNSKTALKKTLWKFSLWFVLNSSKQLRTIALEQF